jgi:hypothetical protein
MALGPAGPAELMVAINWLALHGHAPTETERSQPYLFGLQKRWCPSERDSCLTCIWLNSDGSMSCGHAGGMPAASLDQPSRESAKNPSRIRQGIRHTLCVTGHNSRHPKEPEPSRHPHNPDRFVGKGKPT